MIKIYINTINYGEVINLDQDISTMTISRDTSAQTVAAETLFGRYSLLENAHGQDIQFNYSCVDINDYKKNVSCLEVSKQDHT